MSHHINRYQFSSHPEKEILTLNVQHRVRATKCVVVGVTVTLTRLVCPHQVQQKFCDHPIKEQILTFEHL